MINFLEKLDSRVKELYSPAIPPQTIFMLPQEQLIIKKGSIDYYIENLTKNSGFQKCMANLPYPKSYLTKIGGWHDGQDYFCHFMEDD